MSRRKDKIFGFLRMIILNKEILILINFGVDLFNYKST